MVQKIRRARFVLLNADGATYHQPRPSSGLPGAGQPSSRFGAVGSLCWLSVVRTLRRLQPRPLSCAWRIKRTTEARDNLLYAVDNFPISTTIHYNLRQLSGQCGKHWRFKRQV
jgi:hypothetical protein